MIRNRPRTTLFPYTTLFRSTGFEQGTSENSGRRTGFEQGTSENSSFLTMSGLILPVSIVFAVKAVSNSSAPRSEETRLNSSHVEISYAVFCLKKKKKTWSQK